jgi:lipid-A-disaccharide synthase
MKNPLIFVSTFEFSGDMHGEVLVREILALLPQAKFYGIGGARLAAAGMDLMVDTTKLSTIGFVEAVKNLRRMKRLIKEITREWEKRRPDLFLWLDSGGFNLVLAKEAQKRGIPVICMFSPSAWAYGQDRAVKLAERVDLLLAIFPFEAEFYARMGAKVFYVGHPMLDRVKNDLEPEEYRKSLGIEPGRRLIALLPGSRRQEIANLLPVMLEAVVAMAQDYPLHAVLPVAASLDRAWVETIIQRYQAPCTLTNGGVYNLLAAADAGVVTSGTATLEAALLQTPIVIVYKVSKLSFLVYKILESPEHKGKPIWFGQPNLIMGRQILPELSFQTLNAANIRQHLESYLGNPGLVAQVKQDLAEVKARCGEPGVMVRAAAAVAQLLEQQT